MIEIVLAAAVAIYLAWGVGVHTLGSALGPVIGSGVLKLRGAIVVASVLGLLGFVWLGRGIVNTLGQELVQLDPVSVGSVFVVIAAVTTILAWRGLPLSTTYVVVGALAGFALSHGIAFDLVVFQKIAFALVTSPIAAAVVAFVLYKGLRAVSNRYARGIDGREKFEKMFWLPGLIAFVLLSIALGANSLGVVVGVLRNDFAYPTLLLIGSVGFLIGLGTWSYRVARTVGINLTDLSPSRGFAAQIAAALVGLSFIWFGIPVSMTQTMLGGVLGIGLARKKFDHALLKRIALAWGVALPAAFGLAALIGWLV